MMQNQNRIAVFGFAVRYKKRFRFLCEHKAEPFLTLFLHLFQILRISSFTGRRPDHMRGKKAVCISAGFCHKPESKIIYGNCFSLPRRRITCPCLSARRPVKEGQGIGQEKRQGAKLEKVCSCACTKEQTFSNFVRRELGTATSGSSLPDS